MLNTMEGDNFKKRQAYNNVNMSHAGLQATTYLYAMPMKPSL